MTSSFASKSVRSFVVVLFSLLFISFSNPAAAWAQPAVEPASSAEECRQDPPDADQVSAEKSNSPEKQAQPAEKPVQSISEDALVELLQRAFLWGLILMIKVLWPFFLAAFGLVALLNLLAQS